MRILSPTFIAAFASTGCALDTAFEQFDTTEPNPSSQVEKAEQSLLGGWASGPFTWAQHQQARALASKASNVCVLTRLSGKFEGEGEWAKVFHDGTQWFLGGESKQEGVSAEATCFPHSGFQSGPTKASSAELSIWSRGVSFCSGRAALAWAGDSATFVTGLKGKMAGGGEWVGVDQSPGAFGNSALISHTCATYLTAYGHSFFVGDTLNRKLALFVDTSGRRGDMNAIADFSVGSNRSVKMARATDAMCYFTRIQGGFRGGGEAVEIRAEPDLSGVVHWVMRSKKGGASDQVTARARCYARDQR